MVLVDFRKAFDIIDHHVLLKKLELYRVSDVAVSWFKVCFPQGEILRA